MRGLFPLVAARVISALRPLRNARTARDRKAEPSERSRHFRGDFIVNNAGCSANKGVWEKALGQGLVPGATRAENVVQRRDEERNFKIILLRLDGGSRGVPAERVFHGCNFSR